MQLPEHTPNERHFLSKRQRYQQVPLPDEFSDEELAQQLTLPAPLTVTLAARAATTVEHRQAILSYLGYRRYDDAANAALEAWLARESESGDLPKA